MLLCQILTIWAGIFHTRYLSQELAALGFLESSLEVSSSVSKKSGKTCHLFQEKRKKMSEDI